MSRPIPDDPGAAGPPPVRKHGPAGLKNPEERPAGADEDASAIQAFDEEGAGIAAKE
jgi:hypothetical protein